MNDFAAKGLRRLTLKVYHDCPHLQLDGQPGVGDLGVEILQSRGADGRKHFDPQEDVPLSQESKPWNGKTEDGQLNQREER